MSPEFFEVYDYFMSCLYTSVWVLCACAVLFVSESLLDCAVFLVWFGVFLSIPGHVHVMKLNGDL
jgi:hypothetical protein